MTPSSFIKSKPITNNGLRSAISKIILTEISSPLIKYKDDWFNLFSILICRNFIVSSPGASSFSHLVIPFWGFKEFKYSRVPFFAVLSATILPLLRIITLLQRLVIACILWLTNNTVRPSVAESPILPKHFFWNSASPTARTSSTTSISGSKCADTAKASRTYMPLE